MDPKHAFEQLVEDTIAEIGGLTAAARADLAEVRVFAGERLQHVRASLGAADFGRIVQTEAQSIKARAINKVVQLADRADAAAWRRIDGALDLAARILI